MSSFFETVSASLRILKRHRLLSWLLVIECVFCFILTGLVGKQFFETKQEVDKFQNNIGEKAYYHLTEFLDDTTYYKYMSDASYKYKEIRQFVDAMGKSNDFKYVVEMNQPISIINADIPEVCLYNYENGMSDNEITIMPDGTKISGAKSLQVSYNFLEEFNLKIAEGHSWTPKDFNYDSTKNVPVILGHAYVDTFHIGDTIKGDYLDEKMTFKVIGFIEENAKFVTKDSIENTDRYFLLPSFHAAETPTSFHKWVLLQQLYGIVITDKSFDQINEEINALIAKYGVPSGENGVFLRNPNPDTDMIAFYSAMTEEVQNQFFWLFIILILFVIFTLSITINGFIRDNHYEYGVQLLNGARWSHIQLSVLCLLVAIVGGSCLLAAIVLLLLGKLHVSIIAVAIFIIVISALFPIYHIRRMDISNIIGGKE